MTDKKDDTRSKRSRGKRTAVIAGAAAVLLAGGLAVLEPYVENARMYTVSGSGESSPEKIAVEQQNIIRDSCYSDLCLLGTVYLSRCSGGVYGGSSDLYENMYARLHDIGGSGLYTIDSEQLHDGRTLLIDQSQYSITNIDSRYYYFYVSYDGEYLTNIPKITDGTDPEKTAEELRELYPDWYYLRENDTISTKTKYDESGLGKREVYYTTADTAGEAYLTSEYLDSDKLLIGACSLDSYGRYIYCFDQEGDKLLPSYYSEDRDWKYLARDGSLHISGGDAYQDGESLPAPERVISPDTDDYRAEISAQGGVTDADGSWRPIESMPDYSVKKLDTSGLTVFMAPKSDNIGAYTELISVRTKEYNILDAAGIAMTVLWACCSAAAAAAVMLRRREVPGEGGTPFLYRIMKTDSSLLVMTVCGVLVFLVMNTVLSGLFCGISGNVYINSFYPVMAVLSHIGLLLGLDGLVRQFRLHGTRERHDLLITDIAERLPFVERIRRMSYLTRQRIRFWIFAVCAVGCGLLVLAHGQRLDILFQAEGAVMMAAGGLALLAFIVGSFRAAKEVSLLEGQIDEMLTDKGTAEDEIKCASNRLPASSPLYGLGEKLAEISAMAEKAVEERVKSERMKVELVTNVSHDLKTPLTSIISYIDLLQKEELPEEARDYVSILAKKSDKLRDIVADVFTLAKAVSGVEVDMAELDFAVLARQVLADNEDNAAASGRELREDIGLRSAPITADGMKLYRVIQNLLDNSLKYSMPGTRVYFSLAEREGGYELSVRNVCETEPDFTAEEILERFARGDRSRTDGGSGLGLSIAKSFTEACGGRFSVEIDKDLFTARVFFVRREELPGALDGEVPAVETEKEVNEIINEII